MINNLKEINKDEKWLLKRLENLGYKDTSNILLAICDNKEKLTVFERNLEKEEEQILE